MTTSPVVLLRMVRVPASLSSDTSSSSGLAATTIFAVAIAGLSLNSPNLRFATIVQ